MDQVQGQNVIMQTFLSFGRVLASRLIPAIFLLFATGFYLHGQLISIAVGFDKDTIRIGEQTMYTVTVEQPRDLFVDYPDVSGSMPETIEILRSWPADTMKAGEGRIIVSKSSLVTSFAMGEHFAGEMPFGFFLEGEERVLHSRPVRLEVISPDIDQATGIYDIKAPFGVSWGPAEILPWVLLLIIAGFLVWYLIRYLKRKKSAPAPEGFPADRPREPAHVVALRDLKQLKDEGLWQKGRIKEYYTRLTGIVRIYIEGRFGMRAMEMTSDEITDRLRGRGDLSSELNRLMADLFSVADLVKFAKARPGEHHHHDSLNTAFRFVKETCISQPVTDVLSNGKEDTLSDDKIVNGAEKLSVGDE